MSDELAVQHRVPPYVLVSGPEQLLAERALAQTLDDLRVSEPELETIRLYAAAYTAGELTLHASPSLFGGAKCIVVNDLDRRATFAYAPARMEGHMVASERTDAYVRTAFEVVEALR